MNGMEFWSILIAAVFVQNLVLVYMLFDISFYKALKTPVSGLVFGIIVTASTTLSSMLAWVVNRFLLKPFSLTYLAPFVFVFIIALLEIASRLIIGRFMPAKSAIFGKIIPASAFSCAVLGLVLLNIQSNVRGFLGTSFYGFCAGAGFLLSVFITASALERVRYSAPPAAFKGLPIALVTTGLIALGLMGFSGISVPY